MAVAYAEATGKSSSDVRFSGQSALGVLISHSADYSVGALSLLVACKGLAYRVSLSGFPAMFLGAEGGIAMSHLAGLPLVPAVAMGIAAMCVVLLSLPLTSVLLATLLLLSDGLAVMPLVIVAVVVGYVVSARLAPAPSPTPGPAPTRQGPGNGGPGRGAGPGPLSVCGRAQINRAPLRDHPFRMMTGRRRPETVARGRRTGRGR